MLSVLRVLLLVGIYGVSQGAVATAPLRVLTTIKPLQLIAFAVGGDAVRVDALLDPQFSPHDYQLRPSDRTKVNEADVLFWVGPQLEVFLQPLFSTRQQRGVVVRLQESEGDPHIWMDPIAAIQIAQRMATTFAAVRPERSAYFDANAKQLVAALVRQDAEHRAQLKQLPARNNFMVTHDAYTPFEQRYGFAHRAALTNAADMPPSAKTLLLIERELSEGDITCIWRQPQEGQLYRRLASEKKVRKATIDAMAAQIPIETDGILLFYQRLWEATTACLAGKT